MIHYKLRLTQEMDAPWTDLFILGIDKAYNAATKVWGSDYTAAALTQDYTLWNLVTGDTVNYPLSTAYVKVAVLPGATNLKVDVGITAGGVNFITGAASDLTTVNFSTVPLAALQPYQARAAAVLNARLTSASGNISTITAGEIWIYVCLNRVTDFLTLRQA